MIKEKNGSPNDKELPQEATEKDLLFHLMELVAKEDFTTDELRKLLSSAKKIISQRKPEPGSDSDAD
jgi:phosphoribosyl-ATP pyrophosphohydrolase